MKHRGIVILFILCLGIGYGLYSQSANRDMDKLRATMREFVEAYGSRNIDKVISMYAEDAVYLIPDMEILKGRPAIKAYLSGGDYIRIDFKQQVFELKIEGNLAYEVTNQMVTAYAKDKTSGPFPNKFIHLWQKQKDGTWQVLIDMVNSRPSKS
jgi:ketosteroid isomerase-like protein